MDILFKDEYLKLRLTEEQIYKQKLPPSEIKRGTGKNAVRRIFETDHYDNFENQSLEELKQEMEKMGIDQDIPYPFLLRFLYGNSFDIQDTIKNIDEHLKWRQDPNNFKFTLTVTELLQIGAVYLCGRGVYQRPIIVVNAALMDTNKFSHIDITTTLVINLVIAEAYMLEPKVIETWIVLIDARQSSAFNIGFNYLNQFIITLKRNFPCRLEKILIFEPQTSIQVSWQIVEQFIPFSSRHKIEFINKANKDLLYKFIEPQQLQMKFQGTMDNFYDYWPPQLPKINHAASFNHNNFNTQYTQQQELLHNFMLQKSCRIPNEIQNILKQKDKPKDKKFKDETLVQFELKKYQQREVSNALDPVQQNNVFKKSRFVAPKNKIRQDLVTSKHITQSHL
ncbi:hypothetical protein pb186bvf_006163 [Paramecium bursaria]